MEMTATEIEKIRGRVTRETLPVIESALGIANKMGSRNNAQSYLKIDIEDQNYHEGMDKTLPIRSMLFTAPKENGAVYAQVDAYYSQDSAFSFKLYEGLQKEPLAEGSAEEITDKFEDIIRTRIQESNLIKAGFKPHTLRLVQQGENGDNFPAHEM